MSSSLPSGVQHVSEPTSVGGLLSPACLTPSVMALDPGRKDARVGFGGAMRVPADCKESLLSPPEKCGWAPHLRGFPKRDAVLWCSQQVAPMTSIPLLGDRVCIQFQGLLLEEMNVGSQLALVTVCKILGK